MITSEIDISQTGNHIPICRYTFRWIASRGAVMQAQSPSAKANPISGQPTTWIGGFQGSAIHVAFVEGCL